MADYIKYNHHGREVWVREDLKGRHRDHCLCWSCAAFKPDQIDNCIIASHIYTFCVLTGIVTPVWECPYFEEKQESDEAASSQTEP